MLRGRGIAVSFCSSTPTVTRSGCAAWSIRFRTVRGNSGSRYAAIDTKMRLFIGGGARSVLLLPPPWLPRVFRDHLRFPSPPAVLRLKTVAALDIGDADRRNIDV